MGGGVRKAGFKGGGGGVRLSFLGVNSGVTLTSLRRVDNAVVAVEESCVLDVKSVWNTADYFFRLCSCI